MPGPDPAVVERFLARSGHVHDDWYLQAYPDVAALGLSPAAHYVRLGAAMGRDPSGNFETVHYRDSVPGLADSGMNPLLHYLLHGRGEGRPPHSRIMLRRIRELETGLWGGCPTEAEAGLRMILHDPRLHPRTRAEAALRLAPWCEFQGDRAGARALLQAIPTAVLGRAASLKSVPLAWLQIADGDLAAAQTTLDSLPQNDPTALLLRAGLVQAGPGRLAVINRVYADAGLAGLRLRDAARPLSLGNLAADPVPQGLPDIGKVSIILPCYRAAVQLGAAVAGLQAQSYRNLEIIIVDDASPDDTHAQALALARGDARIRVLRAPQNGGAYAARNLGMALATGDFLTTHDADDWSHPQKIEQQLAPLAADPAVMATGAHWVRCHADLRVTTNWRLSANVLHWSYSSFLFRRAVLDRLGGWDAVRAGADADYVGRLEAVFGAAALVKVRPGVPLAWALDDAGSLTRSRDTHIRSIYHGLRHIYREICLHWLQKPAALLADGGRAKRAMFPPELLTRGPQPPRDLDLHLIGNLSDPRVTARIADLVTRSPGARIGVSHRPELAIQGRFQPDLMHLAEQRRLDLLVPDSAVQAGREIALTGDNMDPTCD